MNITKAIGIGTAVIPIAGILIGGITFGVNFKTDVTNIKEDVAHQAEVNAEVADWFNSIPGAYDDALLWSAVNNIEDAVDTIDIPEPYDDSSLTNRIQKLALDLASLNAEVGNIEVGDTSDLKAQVAELSGQLSAMASIDMTSDDGSVDLGPLVVRIATAEGTLTTLRSSIDSMKGDIRTVKSDITDVERTANAAKNTADSAKSNSGGSRTVENNYDDSNLRSRISTVERQLNALPTTSSSGTTVQRVENPFDDASLRSDISALQTAVAVLQASGGQSYDDSELEDRIDDIQWELDNMEIPTISGSTDTAWLEELIENVKQELSWRLDELEWAATSTGGDDDRYADKWMVEDLQYEVMHIQEQVWELQNLVNDSQSSGNNDTTSGNSTSSGTMVGRNWDGNWAEPQLVHVKHVDSNGNHTYSGDYWMDGYYDTYPVWVNWECGTGQWQYCYIYKYNHTSWVLQPVEPTDQWQANSYNDNGVWPWEGSWAGDVQSVEKGDGY
jgi:hypothetical protein